MLRMFYICLILLCATTAHALDLASVELVRVVDGDTIVVNIAEWPEIVGQNISVRVAGCDTPELRDKRDHMRQKAGQARDTVRTLLENSRTVELKNIRRGKYFRLVADVYADGENISDILISSGLALPYDGKKKPW